MGKDTYIGDQILTMHLLLNSQINQII